LVYALYGLCTTLEEADNAIQGSVIEGVNIEYLQTQLKNLGFTIKTEVKDDAILIKGVMNNMTVDLKAKLIDQDMPNDSYPKVGEAVETVVTNEVSGWIYGKSGTAVGYRNGLVLVLHAIGTKGVDLHTTDKLGLNEVKPQADIKYKVGQVVGNGMVISKLTGGGNYHLNGQTIKDEYLDKVITMGNSLDALKKGIAKGQTIESLITEYGIQAIAYAISKGMKIVDKDDNAVPKSFMVGLMNDFLEWDGKQWTMFGLMKTSTPSGFHCVDDGIPSSEEYSESNWETDLDMEILLQMKSGVSEKNIFKKCMEEKLQGPQKPAEER